MVCRLLSRRSADRRQPFRQIGKQAAGSGHHDQQYVKTLLRSSLAILAEVAPTPAMIWMFSKGFIGIHHAVRVHQLAYWSLGYVRQSAYQRSGCWYRTARFRQGRGIARVAGSRVRQMSGLWSHVVNGYWIICICKDFIWLMHQYGSSVYIFCWRPVDTFNSLRFVLLLPRSGVHRATWVHRLAFGE